MPDSPRTGNHWLYEWIDEFEVYDKDSLEARSRHKPAFERLGEIINAASQDLDYSHIPLTGTVVAGPGLEIDSPSTCTSFDCRLPSLDGDLGALLQYFDYVVMQGPSPSLYARRLEILANGSKSLAAYSMQQDILCLNYIRKTGIGNHVIFAQKPSCFCDTHFVEHARSIGLEAFADREAIADTAKRLSRSGVVRVDQAGPRDWYGYISDPMFLGTIGKAFKQKTRPKKARVADEIIRRELMTIVFDAAAARAMGLPVTSITQPRFFEAKGGGVSPTVDEIATRLQLPILANLTTAQIVELRQEEPAHFEAFRAALREEIANVIAKAPDSSPEYIGELVWQERLKPAVADLERRLASSKRLLSIRSGVALSVGAAAAAAASVITVPAAAAMLGTAVAATLPISQIFEYFKERQQAEMSTMYFLWKAKKMQTHN